MIDYELFDFVNYVVEKANGMGPEFNTDRAQLVDMIGNNNREISVFAILFDKKSKTLLIVHNTHLYWNGTEHEDVQLLHALSGKFRAIELQNQLLSFCNFDKNLGFKIGPNTIHCGDFNSFAESDVVSLMSRKMTPEFLGYLFSNKLKTEHNLIRAMFKQEISHDMLPDTTCFVNCHSAVSQLNENWSVRIYVFVFRAWQKQTQ